MIQKPVNIVIGCAILALTSALALPAQAESASRTWVGPNGGTVHWHGRGDADHYRGTVIVETPDGRTYRRVTTVRRGPDGAYASRKWVGPNGGVAYRAGGVRY
jgi:hypothetical protein